MFDCACRRDRIFEGDPCACVSSVSSWPSVVGIGLPLPLQARASPQKQRSHRQETSQKQPDLLLKPMESDPKKLKMSKFEGETMKF